MRSGWPSTEVSCIDIHAHGVPESFVQEVARTTLAGVSVAVDGRSYRLTFPGGKELRPVTGVMMQFADRAPWLDLQDVSTQFVAPWLDVHGQQLPAADGRTWVRLLNDAVADEVGASAGRLKAYATLHLADPEAAARELARACQQLGFVGCMLPTNFPGGCLDEAKFDVLWEAASSLGVPVVLHPPTVAPSGPAFDRYPALRTLARAVDTTVTAAAMLTSGVLHRFPHLRVVLVHGGGYLPYQVGRLDQGFPDGMPAAGGATPSDVLRQFYFDSTALRPEALAMLVRFAGADHVMVGSDYAATSEQSPWPEHSLLSNLRDIDDRDTGLVLTGTAVRLFGDTVTADGTAGPRPR